MRKVLTLILLLAAMSTTKAQDDLEYRMEIGAGVGMVSYQGDFNGSLLKNMQPMGSIILRRIFNPYMGLRANVSFGKLKGSSDNAETYYPEFATEKYEFNNTLVDFGVTYEYNFWPYGTGREYRGAKKLTPFIFLGIGGTYVKGDEESAFAANFPIGVGVKYKIGPRLNLGLQWGMHFALSDKLDGVEDPYMIKSTGMFKNTDCYSSLQLTLTYSFMPKCVTCNKDGND